MAFLVIKNAFGDQFPWQKLFAEKIEENWTIFEVGAIIKIKEAGWFQTIYIPYHGRPPHFNSPLLLYFPKSILPPCHQIIVTPLSRSDFLPFCQTLWNYQQFFVNNAHTIWLILHQIISKDYFCSVWLITEGDYMYVSRNSGKNESEVLNAVQQMKPTTLTLNCPKLLQNIEIRISCDKCVFTLKILWLSVFSFPPSWIWVLRVCSHSQSYESFKNGILSQKTMFALNGHF